jgi:hypothetical protein
LGPTFFSSEEASGDQRFQASDLLTALTMILNNQAHGHRAAGVELQFSRNDVPDRRVISVIGAAQIRKTPSIAVSSRQ